MSATAAGTALRYSSQVQPPFTPPRLWLKRMQLKQVSSHLVLGASGVKALQGLRIATTASA